MASTLPLAGAAREHRSPRRLVWLIDSLALGGAESLAVSFAAEACARGLDLTVAVRSEIAGNPLAPALRATGARVVLLGARTLRDRAAFARLSRLLAQARPGVLHAHLSSSAIWGALAARRHRIPLVASLHVPPGGGAGVRDRLRERLMVFLLGRSAARVVVVSAALAHDWRGRIAPARLAVVHNGVPLGRPSTSDDRMRGRAELGLPPDAPVAATVAVLRPGKGIETLIAAAAEMLRAQPAARFVVIGDGPMAGAWRDLAERRGVSASFVWTGARNDARDLLAAADLFVLPTRGDAFPTALLEAMAAGLPVVASRVGGVPEIVDAPSTGRLVPPGDPDALAQALIDGFADEGWRSAAGRAARARAEERFSTARWADRLEELYAEAAAGAPEDGR